MKNRAPAGFLKQTISVITAVAKAKTMALKSKTRAIKTRLIIFSLLRNRKMMSSISDKIRTLMAHQEHEKKLEEEQEEAMGDEKKAIILSSNAMSHESLPNLTHTEFLEKGEEDDEYLDSDKYPDLTHSLCDSSYLDIEFLEKGEEDDEYLDSDKYPDLTHSLCDSSYLDIEDPGGSVIDLVKNSKPEGEEFRLENEIDQLADLYIKSFHRRMRIQRQLSFKRDQEMLERTHNSC